jgi:type II secretory pathway pseudopilin PulG
MVLSIVGILASTIVLNLNRQAQSAHDTSLMLEVDALRSAIIVFQTQNSGVMPTTLNQLIPRYLTRFKQEWRGSLATGVFSYDGKSGVLTLLVKEGLERDLAGRRYYQY